MPTDRLSKPAKLPADARKPLRFAILATVAAACLIVILTAATDSISLAMRSATDLVMPLGLLWCLLLATGLFLWRSGHKRPSTLFFTAFFALAGCGNDRIAGHAIGTIESQYPEPVIETPLDAVVVLGGSSSVNLNGTRELADDGERIFSAAQLWHAGMTARIIITGGRPGDPLAPHLVVRELLVSVGVPDDVIISIPGDNTTQEMASLKKLLNANGSEIRSDAQIALITSAFHLPRAIRLSKTQQLDLIPVPVAFKQHTPHPLTPGDLIPNAHALTNFSRAAKETLAGILGR